MGTRTFTVTVKLTVDEAADPQEIVDADFPEDT